MEWMSAIDSSFLHVENDTTPMHIGGVSIFAGPPPDFEQLRAMVAGKLDLVPRYRQKVRFVPLGAGAPVWIDDPHFSLGYHLRHTGLPAPGSETQMREMAARVFSQHDVPLPSARTSTPDIPVPVNARSNTEALAGTAPANAATPAITPANTKLLIGNPLIDKDYSTMQP